MRIAPFILVFCAALPAGALGEPTQRADTAALIQVVVVDTSAKAPVVLGNDTLFIIAAGMRGLPAGMRAARISERVHAVAQDDGTPLDSIVIAEAEVATEIVAGNVILCSVYDADARLAGTTRAELARERAGVVREAIARYREERSRGTILTGILVSVVATIALIVVLWLLRWGRRRLEAALGTRMRGISIQEHEVVRADWLRAVAKYLVLVAFWVLVAVFLYAYLEVLLTRFIWTRQFAQQLLRLTLDPLETLALGMYAYLPNLFFLIILVIVTRLGLKFLRFFFREVEAGRVTIPGFYPDWSMPTYRILRVLVIAFAAVVAFPYIPGSSSPAFQGISIFLGLLFSLGSTSAVANVIAGFIIDYMRAYRVGDFVKIQETVGVVISNGLLVTRIRDLKNVEITVPNSTVLGHHVINYSNQAREGKLILHTSVTIGYDAPWRQVHALLRMAVERTPDLLKEPPPFVLQRSLDDFFVNYEINAYTAAPEKMLDIYSDLHKNIQDAFNEHGVQIMSPHFMTDRETPPVVPKSRWYAPPAVPAGEPGADT